MKERLIVLMQEKGLNSASLAEIGGVQPSAISHFMSDRNKPGYDFLYNLLNYFRDINARWLLLGDGEMYNSESKEKQAGKNHLTPAEEVDEQPLSNRERKKTKEAIVSDNQITDITDITTPSSTVKKVILIYSDGTFEELKHK